MSEGSLAKPRTLKEHIKTFLVAAFMVFLPILLIELLLRTFDPWRISFFDDMAYMGTAYETDLVRGYILPDGEYQFSNWQANIQDGSRLIPNNNENADCKIILLGDSFTFGYGVDDAETWANLLAINFPNVYFVNAGNTAYNSTNVLGTLKAFTEADAYLYLNNGNDWEPTLNPGDLVYRNAAETMPYIVRYGNFAYHRNNSEEPSELSFDELLAEPIIQRYVSDLEQIVADNRLSLVMFEGGFLTDFLQAQGISFQTILYPQGYGISYVDGHLNAEGNRVLAERINPIVASIIEESCTSTSN